MNEENNPDVASDVSGFVVKLVVIAFAAVIGYQAYTTMDLAKAWMKTDMKPSRVCMSVR